jgi:hypothetical protein
MRKLALAAAAALLISGTALAEQGEQRLRDLDPSMNDKLNTKSNLEFFVGADWIFELGPDAPNQTGWGLSTGCYVLPDSRGENGWRTKWGGSFTYFSTTGSEDINGINVRSAVDAGYVVLEYGVFRDLGNNWEAGVMGGIGTGAFFGESDDGSSVDAHGNWDWVLQIKPTVVWKPTKKLQVFLAYKFAYMTPFYDTNLIGYRTVSFLHNALEAGVTWRF